MRGAIHRVLYDSTQDKFQSAPPVRGAMEAKHVAATDHWVSIRAPREGSDIFDSVNFAMGGVSIRAPREGSDRRHGLSGRMAECFNPRPP